MPFAVLQEMQSVTAEMYDAVNGQMDTVGDPPEGLIFHTGGPMKDGGWRVFDVWESEDEWERFRSERLAPAVSEVSQGQAQPPHIEVYELHGFITP